MEKRAEDVLKAVTTLTTNVNQLAEKVTRLEMQQAHLRESVRNEIMADIKSDIVKTTMLVEKNNNNRAKRPAVPRIDR